MIPTLPLVLFLSAQTPLYGEDMVTFFAKRLGYDGRVQPCSVADGDVELAVHANGDVVYNGVRRPVDVVAKMLHAGRLDIRSVCLYVEGPTSRAANDALRLIESAASGSDLGFGRCTDPEFTKRVARRFPSASPKRGAS